MRIWIVGGSGGIGYALVKRWLGEGHRVVVSARSAENAEPLQNLAAVYGKNLSAVNLDVMDDGGMDEACRRAWKAFDGIDLWFYNPGAYEPMGTDEWNLDAFERMTQINYMGAVRLMTRLLPYFEHHGSGRWVWNASLASYFGLPYGGGYSAPKAALVNLAESLQPELMQKNIRLQIINHGFVKTRLTAKNDFEMPGLMTPEYAAGRIADALQNSERFETHFPKKLSFFLGLLRLLPYRISLALTRKMLR